MFELMKDEDRWELINAMIRDIEEERKFGDDEAGFDITNEGGEDSGYCEKCGGTGHIFVRGFRCSGIMCIHCGHEEVDNDYW